MIEAHLSQPVSSKQAILGSDGSRHLTLPHPPPLLPVFLACLMFFYPPHTPSGGSSVIDTILFHFPSIIYTARAVASSLQLPEICSMIAG